MYYWFTNSENVSVKAKDKEWAHIITSSLQSKGMDVDLYVSAVDGRLPGELDFDWSSTNVGPDDIYIASNDTFFKLRNTNTSNGIIFVVGVKALTDNAVFSIMMIGPDAYSQSITELVTFFP